MNIVHPVDTHDMASVVDRTSPVVGGEALDDDYNQRIVPPVNPHKRGRPQSKMRGS